MIDKGTKILIAGATINFSLGIFYAWSVFAEGLIHEYGWTQAEAALPYTVEVLVFSIAMVFAGRFQDRVGPRQAAYICGLLSGASFLLCYFFITPLAVTLLFGVLFGIAPAFGFAATIPAALKWFPPEKRGLASGLVIMPMGAAPLIWSPLVKMLLGKVGVRGAFGICGIFVLLSITLAAQVLTAPEKIARNHKARVHVAPLAGGNWSLLLCSPVFVLLWLIDGFSAGVGFMFIGQLAQIAVLNYRISWGYLLVSLFSVTNTLGRLAGGVLCDRIGWMHTIRLTLVLQIASMILFLSGWEAALVAAALILGACYGLICASIPITLESLFGLEDFGFIYGMLTTSNGVTGFAGPLAAAALADRYASYSPAFLIGLAATLLCLVLSFILQRRLQAAAGSAAGIRRGPENAGNFKQRDWRFSRRIKQRSQ